jgi:O-acetyl-ADP-ribose deacetylase (regulator of RNase III)
MQIRNVSFDELPASIKEIAEKEIGNVVGFLDATIFEYGFGNKDYIVHAVTSHSIVEMTINSKRGVSRVDMVSLSAVREAIEKFPERF